MSELLNAAQWNRKVFINISLLHIMKQFLTLTNKIYNNLYSLHCFIERIKKGLII